jgi:hypothetical protein
VVHPPPRNARTESGVSGGDWQATLTDGCKQYRDQSFSVKTGRYLPRRGQREEPCDRRLVIPNVGLRAAVFWITVGFRSDSLATRESDLTL